MFDPQKSYLHPVLRPQSEDYPEAEFEVTVSVERFEQTTAVMVEADFALSDPDLLDLVEQGIARYVLQIRSPKTYFRSSISTGENHIRVDFPNGRLAGRTEFSPFLVATKPIRDFRVLGWHEDYAGMSFNIETGSVLAVDQHVEYTIDVTEEGDVGSIFELVETGKLLGGMWRIDHGSDRVRIEMSPQDCARFKAARESANNRPEAAYIMNSIYLPALIWLLAESDKDNEELSDRRWFRALDACLSRKGLPLLGVKSDRVKDAQQLLEYPFHELPLLTDQDVAL